MKRKFASWVEFAPQRPTPDSFLAVADRISQVIKALYDYQPEPETSQELAFSKGDFFHVISREDDSDWYEACNPLIPSARGLVPVSFFEVIGKNERDSGGSGDLSKDHDSGFSDRGLSQDSPITQNGAFRMSALKGQGAMVYGIVQYDFQAERPDELDAKAGEAIIVIAQSNPEWFVAKPIGRLGGPGLIPVSFIELRDMQSGQAVADPLDAVRRAGVPKVEEWKKMTAEYKNSSITLGKIDAGHGGGNTGAVTPGMENMPMGHQSQMSQNGNAYVGEISDSHLRFHLLTDDAFEQEHQRNASKGTLSQVPMSQQGYQLLVPVSAYIPRYCFDNDKYWYIIEAKMEDGRCWELSRYYHDFYDFQIALLTQFEDEAGNRGRGRTLPFMPGPVTHVTDAISNGRRQNLDEYIKKLLSMPPHISRCQLVCELFSPREGDFEIDPNAFGEDARFSAGSQQSGGVDPQESVSRQSSQQQISVSTERISQQRAPAPTSSANGGPPPVNRQPSSITQASGASTNSAMKVKVFFQDDLIAIRIPSGVSMQHLKDKLCDRLKIQDDIVVQYRDESSGSYIDLYTDQDLENAMQRNTKLTLFVNVA
ncbi:Phox/Bem1p [Penicillium italicum]|uniref:Phox/Bem1p n=1 Tax=Penicillium italicum TaxID=40296 RepID=A0A0A2L326_PENIT|nr:Phox/Bem1p [Penicillium italicum]